MQVLFCSIIVLILLKNIYDAEHAHIKASEVISEARSSLCVSEDEIARLNRGGFSDYKKIERESTSLWLVVFFYDTA